MRKAKKKTFVNTLKKWAMKDNKWAKNVKNKRAQDRKKHRNTGNGRF